jgi:hypothetical protein
MEFYEDELNVDNREEEREEVNPLQLNKKINGFRDSDSESENGVNSPISNKNSKDDVKRSFSNSYAYSRTDLVQNPVNSSTEKTASSVLKMELADLQA